MFKSILGNDPIPENWEMTKLENICISPQYGWTTSASKTGKIHLLRTTDITRGKIDWNSVPYCKTIPKDVNKYLLHENDIVISRAGSIGFSSLIKNPDKAIFASYLIRFTPLISSEYLSYFLKTPKYWDFVAEKNAGIAIPNINASKLKQLDVPIAPLNEQKRIVSKLEELFTKLDAGIEYLKKTQILLKQYRQSVLKYAFEGKLTEKWRKEKNNKKSFKQIEEFNKNKSQIPNIYYDIDYEIPREWRKINLFEIIKKIKRGPSLKCNREGKGIRYITSGNLDNGYLNLASDYKFLAGFKGVDKCKLLDNDLILNCVNSIELIGKSAVFKKEYGQAIVGFNNYALELDLSLVSPFYLNLFCQTNIFKKQLYFLIKRAVNQVSFAIDDIKKIVVILPPLVEQNFIVNDIEKKLSVLKITNDSIIHNLKYTNNLRQSILKYAFEGKLIPQDPNDEPSYILLEKIKQDKSLEEHKLRKSHKEIKDIPHPKQTRLFS